MSCQKWECIVKIKRQSWSFISETLSPRQELPSPPIPRDLGIHTAVKRLAWTVLALADIQMISSTKTCIIMTCCCVAAAVDVISSADIWMCWRRWGKKRNTRWIRAKWRGAGGEENKGWWREVSTDHFHPRHQCTIAGAWRVSHRTVIDRDRVTDRQSRPSYE